MMHFLFVFLILLVFVFHSTIAVQVRQKLQAAPETAADGAIKAALFDAIVPAGKVAGQNAAESGKSEAEVVKSIEAATAAAAKSAALEAPFLPVAKEEDPSTVADAAAAAAAAKAPSSSVGTSKSPTAAPTKLPVLHGAAIKEATAAAGAAYALVSPNVGRNAYLVICVVATILFGITMGLRWYAQKSKGQHGLYQEVPDCDVDGMEACAPRGRWLINGKPYLSATGAEGTGGLNYHGSQSPVTARVPSSTGYYSTRAGQSHTPTIII